MTPQLGQLVRDTSRNGVYGIVNTILSKQVIVRTPGVKGRAGIAYIRLADCAIGQHPPKRIDPCDDEQYDAETRRLARACGLHPKEVIEARA